MEISHVKFLGGGPGITCGFFEMEISHVIFLGGGPGITCGFFKSGISHVIQLESEARSERIFVRATYREAGSSDM